MMKRLPIAGLCLWGALGLLSSSAQATAIQVEIENRSPTDGLFFTPVWLGFHDGGFDTFDAGSAASSGLERLAEDGNAGPIGSALASAQSDSFSAVVLGPSGFPGAPVFDPGEIATVQFDLDPTANRFLSYLSMLIPSNDAFFGNADALALFDPLGVFVGDITISVLGSNIYDAGTEDNTEIAAAFLNQSTANEGSETVGGVITQHLGFDPTGNILGQTNPPGFFFDPVLADFTRDNGLVEIAEIRITQATQVPEPNAAALMLIGALGIGASQLRRRKTQKLSA